MTRTVSIDLGPPCSHRFGPDEAVVVVDVIRAMTTALTAAALGARLLPVASLEEALRIAGTLPRPLLCGELDGVRPDGFDLSNSPAALARRRDLHERQVVLLSSSGTPLLDEVRRAGAVYPACLRNQRAVADHVAQRHSCVTVIGAATRGAFREEDQLCCGFIAGRLVEAGFAIGDEATAVAIARWADAPPEALLVSKSVDYLKRTGQLDDLDFILQHVDDLDAVFRLHAGELLPAEAVRHQRLAAM